MTDTPVNRSAGSKDDALVARRGSGTMLVRGPAGSGKTRFLVERARFLLDEVFRAADDRILLTSFTVGGLKELEALAAELLPAESRQRLSFLNVQPWARSLLEPRMRGLRVAGAREVEDAWRHAFAETGPGPFPERFYRDEWERVVQTEEIATRTAYVKARREGRATRLDRSQRLEVWDLLWRMKSRLDAEGLLEWTDVLREARLLFEEGHERRPFAAILVDDAQDFRPGELRLLAAIVRPGDDAVVLAGDPRQRLFGFPSTLAAAAWPGPVEIHDLCGRHRSPPELLARAEAIFGGLVLDDLAGGTVAIPGGASVLRRFGGSAEEDAFLVETLKDWSRHGDDLLVFLPDVAQIESRFRPLLDAAGLEGLAPKLLPIGAARGRSAPRVLVAGLDVAALEGPEATEAGLDRPSQDERRCRRLARVYVALTRATLEFRAGGT